MLVRLLMTLAVPLSSLAPASPAVAQCQASREFDQVVRESPMLVVGRVVSTSNESIDMDVTWDVRGTVPERRVRVWDFFWASENARLSGLNPGDIVLIAALPVTAFLSGHGPFNFNAKPADLAVES